MTLDSITWFQMLPASFSVSRDHSAVIPTRSVARASGAGSRSRSVLWEAAWAPLQQELMNMLQGHRCSLRTCLPPRLRSRKFWSWNLPTPNSSRVNSFSGAACSSFAISSGSLRCDLVQVLMGVGAMQVQSSASPLHIRPWRSSLPLLSRDNCFTSEIVGTLR